MSDQGASRRRKIAGERRRGSGASPPVTDSPAQSPGLGAGGSDTNAATPPHSHQPQWRPSGGDDGAKTTSWPSVPGWLLAGLAVLLAAVTTFDVIVAVKDNQRTELAQTRTSSLTSAYNTAPAEAEKAATQILGYDYQTLEQDAEEATSFMTDSYAKTFQKTVDGLLTAPARQVKAHVEARVMASGVASAEPNEVQVLLFVDQVSRTTANKEPQTALNRVVFTMVKSGDRWLVNEITAL